MYTNLYSTFVFMKKRKGKPIAHQGELLQK